MKDGTDEQIKRLIRIAKLWGVIILALIIIGVSWVSLEVASFKEQIQKDVKSYLTTAIATNKPLNVEEVAKKVADIVGSPKDGKDGSSPPCLNEASKCQGKDGKDSVSTNTIIQKEITVYYNKPGIDGVDGKNGREREIAQTTTGSLVWKYADDRSWQKIPVISLLNGEIYE